MMVRQSCGIVVGSVGILANDSRYNELRTPSLPQRSQAWERRPGRFLDVGNRTEKFIYRLSVRREDDTIPENLGRAISVSRYLSANVFPLLGACRDGCIDAGRRSSGR